MNEKEKQQVKDKILGAITAAEKDIVSLKELTRPIAPDVAIGRLSRMEAIGNKSINEAALTLAQTRRAKLKFALANIDKADFGICRDCEEPIPIGRILIMPESVFCVHCAE